MPQSAASSPQRMTRISRFVLGTSCINLALLCVVSYLIYGVSETWWVGTVLTYAPRTPYLVPSVLLIIGSLIWNRESIGINLISLVIILVPIMGLSIPLELWMNGPQKTAGETPFRLVSCNVQAFEPDFDKVLEEISKINPDIVAMQETSRGDPRLDSFFHDWQTLRHGNLWVGSRFPMKMVSEIAVTQFHGRVAGLIVQIDSPAGPIVLCDVHQMTVRWGLKELNRYTLVNGTGIKELEAWEHERYLESIEIRSAIDSACKSRPLIVCGDFNTPSSSSLFQKHWGDLQNAYDVAAFGYGYTSPCKSNRFWPDNVPWARIDHILCSNEWSIRQCQIGETNGSDHRLIAAKIVLKAREKTATISRQTQEKSSP